MGDLNEQIERLNKFDKLNPGIIGCINCKFLDIDNLEEKGGCDLGYKCKDNSKDLYEWGDRNYGNVCSKFDVREFGYLLVSEEGAKTFNGYINKDDGES